MTNTTGLAILIAVVALLLGGIFTYAAFPREVIKQAQPQLINVPVVNSYNDTAIKADIAAIKAEVTKDATWEADAEKLATSEWAEKSNKDIFNALVDLGVAIDDKEDIKSIAIKDSDVTSSDIDEQDATVVQELKVYYENSDGDTKKVLLDVTSEIEDGEVVDQTIEFH